jgi:peptidoglycan-associated lipoprotein
MLKPTFSIPVACCLIAGALAACANDPPPPASDVFGTSTTRPRDAGQRADLTRDDLTGLVAVGDRVYFAYDSSLLVGDAQRTLQRQAVWLKEHPAVSLTIEGHADERGTREYNLALGARRADAVRDFLVAQGVGGDRLRTVSYGKERPQLAGSDEASWARNRRGVSVPR